MDEAKGEGGCCEKREEKQFWQPLNERFSLAKSTRVMFHVYHSVQGYESEGDPIWIRPDRHVPSLASQLMMFESRESTH